MFSHAAFARDDLEDARRGHPAVDLGPYAQAEGLDLLGRGRLPEFIAFHKAWDEHTFNVMRGEVVPGRYGMLSHELYQVDLGDDHKPLRSGAWHGKRLQAKGGGFRVLVGLERKVRNEPFGAHAMWLPTTTIRLLVPEAVLLPTVFIASKEYMPFSDPTLKPTAPDLRINRMRAVDDQLQARIAEVLGPTLQGLRYHFVELRKYQGAMELTVNGYVTDPERLTALRAAAGAIADGMAQLAAPWFVTAPFERHFGNFDPSRHPPGYVSFASSFTPGGLDALQKHAAEHSMQVEDPVNLHRAIPRLPIPGASRGSLFGQFPGSTAVGRLTWTYEGQSDPPLACRGAALFTARSGTPDTPVGGRLLASTNMFVAARDGVACCWTTGWSPGRLESANLVTRALASMRESGLADV